MNRLRYVLEARAEVVEKPQQYEIDWDRIRVQVQEAQQLLDSNIIKEPTMKKKPGRKKKGY